MIARGEVLDFRSLVCAPRRTAAASPRRRLAPRTCVSRAFCSQLSPRRRRRAERGHRAHLRDSLEALRRSPARIAKRFSALRALADALDADPLIVKVRSQRVARGPASCASRERVCAAVADARRALYPRQARPALVYLLGTAGLRRSEPCALVLSNVDECRRSGDGRLRRAIAHFEFVWVTVRCAKRGRTARSARFRRARHDRPAGQGAPDGGLRAGAAVLAAYRPAAARADPRDAARIVPRCATAAGCPRTAAHRTAPPRCSARSSPTSASASTST